MSIARLNDGAGKSVIPFIGNEVHDGQHRGDLDTVVKNKRMMPYVVVVDSKKKRAQTNSHSAQHKQRQRGGCIYRRLCNDPRRRPKNRVLDEDGSQNGQRPFSDMDRVPALIVGIKTWTFYFFLR